MNLVLHVATFFPKKVFAESEIMGVDQNGLIVISITNDAAINIKKVIDQCSTDKKKLAVLNLTNLTYWKQCRRGPRGLDE